jgi:hypothetical protein
MAQKVYVIIAIKTTGKRYIERDRKERRQEKNIIKRIRKKYRSEVMIIMKSIKNI